MSALWHLIKTKKHGQVSSTCPSGKVACSLRGGKDPDRVEAMEAHLVTSSFLLLVVLASTSNGLQPNSDGLQP